MYTKRNLNVLTLGNIGMAYSCISDERCTPATDVRYLKLNKDWERASTYPMIEDTRLPTGNEFTYYSAIGDELIRKNIYDRVKFVNIAVENSTVKMWQKLSLLYDKETPVLSDRFKYDVTKRLWKRIQWAKQVLDDTDEKFKY